MGPKSKEKAKIPEILAFLKLPKWDLSKNRNISWKTDIDPAETPKNGPNWTNFQVFWVVS